MTKKKRQFSPEFKKRVVLEIIKEEKTMAQIRAEYQVPPSWLYEWKKLFYCIANRFLLKARMMSES